MFTLRHTEYVVQTDDQGGNPVVSFHATLTPSEAVHDVSVAFNLEGLPPLLFQVAALAPQEQAPGYSMEAEVDFGALPLGPGTNPVTAGLAVIYSTGEATGLTEAFDLAGDIWFVNFTGSPSKVRLEASMYPVTP